MDPAGGQVVTDTSVVDFVIFPTDASKPDTLRSDILSFAAKWVLDYAWTYEAFTLQIHNAADDTGHYLGGCMDFKDNMEDEWFVISLLLRITKAFPDVVARVTDRDVGEVLLVEAADVLQEWAQEPDAMEKRVYLHRGEVHVVPVAQNPGQITPLAASNAVEGDEISPAQIARIVAKYPKVTRAADEIQKCIRKRCGSYPEDWSAQAHYTHFLLPPKVAGLFAYSPRLLYFAVQHLAEEVAAARAGDIKKISPPHTNNAVKLGVEISRCSYAMLQGVRTRPRKRSSWTLPNQNEDGFEAAWNGYRVSLGIDLMMRLAEKRGREKEELKCSSAEESVLHDARVRQYISLNENISSDEDDQGLIDLRLSMLRCKENPAAMKQMVDELTSAPLLPSGDAAWMHVKPDDFERLLQEHFKGQKEEGQTVRNLAEFVDAESDMTGIEPPPDQPIDFDPEQFSSAMEKVLAMMGKENGEVDEDEEDDLAIEEGLEDLLTKQVFGGVREADRFRETGRNLVESLEGQINMSGPAATLLYTLPN
jgi:hypothetical protein